MVRKGFLKVVMSGLGFEGSVGVGWTERRAVGKTMYAKVWYPGDWSEVGIVVRVCVCTCA